MIEMKWWNSKDIPSILWIFSNLLKMTLMLWFTNNIYQYIIYIYFKCIPSVCLYNFVEKCCNEIQCSIFWKFQLNLSFVGKWKTYNNPSESQNLRENWKPLVHGSEIQFYNGTQAADCSNNPSSLDLFDDQDATS